MDNLKNLNQEDFSINKSFISNSLKIHRIDLIDEIEKMIKKQIQDVTIKPSSTFISKK